MRRRTDITVEELGNGIFRLNEFDFANAFLVLGKEKACLIDTCAGTSDLGGVVRSLTDLPVTVLITHAHADHIGGAVWFKQVYLHPADLQRGQAYWKPPAKLYFLYCHKYKKKTHHVRYADVFQKDCSPELLLLNEGDVFDLGGRTIETFLTPGHSAGSVIFRDSLTGTVFSGDNVNPMVTLQYPGAVTVKEWIAGAERTLELTGDAQNWGGHGNAPISPQTIAAALEMARDLVAKGNRTPRKTAVSRGTEKYPCIYYKTDRVE